MKRGQPLSYTALLGAMTITIGMLQILANKYGFDINEAREAIGLSSGKRGRPAKSGGSPEPKRTDPKPAKESTKPRGKSGYHLYMASVKERVANELKSNLKGGEKITGRQVISEVGKRWKLLPEGTRDMWNSKS